VNWSQYGQDAYLRSTYLQGVDKGFFLELGALDGLRHSNTKSFEDIGWSGICIEAHPELFKLLVQNRDCICVEALISSRASEISKFLAIDPNGPVGLSGLVKDYDPRHIQRIRNECRAAGVSANEISIASRTLAEILNEHEVKHIDFFSLDVEGSELDVLLSVDYDYTSFGVLLVENNYLTTECEDFLASKGYRKAERRHVDDIYVPALKGR